MSTLPGLRHLMQQRVSVGRLRVRICAGVEQEFKGLQRLAASRFAPRRRAFTTVIRDLQRDRGLGLRSWPS